MNTKETLEVRALFSRAVNAAINAGATPLQVAMIMDSIKADLLIQVPYNVLAEKETEEDANAKHE